jgi:hypothetical protein
MPNSWTLFIVISELGKVRAQDRALPICRPLTLARALGKVTCDFKPLREFLALSTWDDLHFNSTERERTDDERTEKWIGNRHCMLVISYFLRLLYFTCSDKCGFFLKMLKVKLAHSVWESTRRVGVFEEKLQLLNHNQLCSLSNAFISTYRR